MTAISPLSVDCDFCVVGAGIAGICAALAAARRGMKVALVHNRSVLGGNASSEVRQAIGGACFSGHFPDAREGGVVDEIWSSIRKRSLGGNMNDLAESSLRMLELCWAEPNLSLYLSTHVTEVQKEGAAIVSVSGVQTTTGKWYRFAAAQFADCTGDANVAFLAGCAFLSGQESKAAFDESLAPEIATALTMGNTLLFQAEKLACPVPYERPAWVPDLRKIDCYWTLHPPTAPMEHGSWVFEYGGRLDTIADAEKIQEELYRIVYAAWADLKSRPEVGMENYRISFMSSIPGKRESRRVIGDYILNQNDIVQVQRFSDDVAYAGWSLDLHNHDGFWGAARPTTFYFFPDIYSIPLRCLYARDADNLWLAGRDISVTHVALGGARLMASCGLEGEAVGIAASVARQRNHKCREVAQTDIKAVQQEILKSGGFIPGVRNEDPCDLAPRARIEATSEAALSVGEPTIFERIGDGIGLAFPITEGRLDSLRLAVKNEGAATVELKAVLQPIRFIRDFHPTQTLKEAHAQVAPGGVEAEFRFDVDLDLDLWMIHIFSSDPELLIGQNTSRATGVHVADFFPKGKEDIWARELGMPEPACWERRFNNARLSEPEVFHKTPCFEVFPRQAAYRAANVANGINRPVRLPNMWVSSPQSDLPQSLVLHWDAPVELSEVRIVFDGDMDLSQPPVAPSATLVRDYEMVASNSGTSQVLASVKNNQQRFVVHRFPAVSVTTLRLDIQAIHGAGRQARICEVRCY